MNTPPDITPRERQVWLGICAGNTQREIAGIVRYSRSTVGADRMTLARKLGLRTRDIAAHVRAAAVHGMLAELPPLNVRAPQS